MFLQRIKNFNNECTFLLSSVRFDVRYKIKGQVNSESKKHEFVGEYGWEMKWSEPNNGFMLQNPKVQGTKAIFKMYSSFLNTISHYFNSKCAETRQLLRSQIVKMVYSLRIEI